MQSSDEALSRKSGGGYLAVVKGAGVVLSLSLRTMELARASYDPKSKTGVAEE